MYAANVVVCVCVYASLCLCLCRWKRESEGMCVCGPLLRVRWDMHGTYMGQSQIFGVSWDIYGTYMAHIYWDRHRYGHCCCNVADRLHVAPGFPCSCLCLCLFVSVSVSVSVRVRAKCGMPYREEVRWCARCDIVKEKVLYMCT